MEETMSRDRSKDTAYVNITPELSRMSEALAIFARTMGGSVDEVQNALTFAGWRPMPDSYRYWEGFAGRVLRTPGMKSLLHKGGKP